MIVFCVASDGSRKKSKLWRPVITVRSQLLAWLLEVGSPRLLANLTLSYPQAFFFGTPGPITPSTLQLAPSLQAGETNWIDGEACPSEPLELLLVCRDSLQLGSEL